MFASDRTKDSVPGRSVCAGDNQEVSHPNLGKNQEAPVNRGVECFVESLLGCCEQTLNRLDVNRRLQKMPDHPDQKKDPGGSRAKQYRCPRVDRLHHRQENSPGCSRQLGEGLGERRLSVAQTTSLIPPVPGGFVVQSLPEFGLRSVYDDVI